MKLGEQLSKAFEIQGAHRVVMERARAQSLRRATYTSVARRTGDSTWTLRAQEVTIERHPSFAEKLLRETGLSEARFWRASQVYRAAQEDPARYGSLLQEMLDDENVYAAYTRLLAAKEAGTVPETSRPAVHRNYPHRNHTRELKKACAMLDGLMQEFGQVIPALCPLEVRREAAQRLRRSRRQLGVVIKFLEGALNGANAGGDGSTEGEGKA